MIKVNVLFINMENSWRTFLAHFRIYAGPQRYMRPSVVMSHEITSLRSIQVKWSESSTVNQNS